ncbi:MAG: hypothetical protein Q4A37_01180 [Candidatus Saccharibacteria bacterium]|nr:hypothetical protein [Candidatus Saccharibacteria bacterium]
MTGSTTTPTNADNIISHVSRASAAKLTGQHYCVLVVSWIAPNGKYTSMQYARNSSLVTRAITDTD